MEPPTVVLTALGLGPFITFKVCRDILAWAKISRHIRHQHADRASAREMNWYDGFHKSGPEPLKSMGVLDGRSVIR